MTKTIFPEFTCEEKLPRKNGDPQMVQVWRIAEKGESGAPCIRWGFGIWDLGVGWNSYHLSSFMKETRAKFLPRSKISCAIMRGALSFLTSQSQVTLLVGNWQHILIIFCINYQAIQLGALSMLGRHRKMCNILAIYFIHSRNKNQKKKEHKI